MPMANAIYPYRLTALTPWAWHGLAVPSGTATLNDVVTDTAMAFATATALGMAPRVPCLPGSPSYRTHLAAIPFKASLFLGEGNRLNRPLARRLNLDSECGMPKSIDTARKSGNIKDYYHVQEVAAGSVFDGWFLHGDPLSIALDAYGEARERLVIRLGLGRTGVGLLTPRTSAGGIQLNLHTAQLFDPAISVKAGPYRLHTIQPSVVLEAAEALEITAAWRQGGR